MKAGHSNTIFSVRDIVSGTDGAVLQSYEYTENGEKTTLIPAGPQSDKTWVGGLSVNDDTADSGLYLMGHRHYDSTTGRFLSRDPIGFAGGLNLYEYSSNSPVTMTDAWGLNPTLEASAARDVSTGLKKIAVGVGLTQAAPVVIDPGDAAGVIMIGSGAKDVTKGIVKYVVSKATSPSPGGAPVPSPNPAPGPSPKPPEDDDDCRKYHYLHRAVGPNERQSVDVTGRFSPNPSGIDGKYFYPTKKQAIIFANSHYNRNKPAMWRATGILPAGTPHTHITPGTEGPAIFVGNTDIPMIQNATVRERIK